MLSISWLKIVHNSISTFDMIWKCFGSSCPLVLKAFNTFELRKKAWRKFHTENNNTDEWNYFHSNRLHDFTLNTSIRVCDLIDSNDESSKVRKAFVQSHINVSRFSIFSNPLRKNDNDRIRNTKRCSPNMNFKLNSQLPIAKMGFTNWLEFSQSFDGFQEKGKSNGSAGSGSRLKKFHTIELECTYFHSSLQSFIRNSINVFVEAFLSAKRHTKCFDTQDKGVDRIFISIYRKTNRVSILTLRPFIHVRNLLFVVPDTFL